MTANAARTATIRISPATGASKKSSCRCRPMSTFSQAWTKTRIPKTWRVRSAHWRPSNNPKAPSSEAKPISDHFRSDEWVWNAGRDGGHGHGRCRQYGPDGDGDG